MIGAFDALWSVVLDDLNTAEWIATLGISLFALPIVIFGGAGGRLAQRVGPFRVGTIGLLLGAMWMALYGLVPSGEAMFAVAMVHAVSDGLTASSTGVAVGLVVPAERQAGAQGVLGGMETLTAGITAIAAGALYDAVGRTTTYLVIAAVMVAVVAAGAALARDVFGRTALATDVPEMVDRVVDEVAGKCIHGELGAVTTPTGPVPLVTRDGAERSRQGPAGVG